MTSASENAMPRPVKTNFKQPCPCDYPKCDKTGSPTKKVGHVRGCPCPRCGGSRNRRNGLNEQRAFAKAAGIVRASFRGANGNEEAWGDPLRWEHKAGAQVRPVVTAYRRARRQSEASRAVGDTRPFALGVSVDDERLVVLTAEDWGAYIAPRLHEDGAA